MAGASATAQCCCHYLHRGQCGARPQSFRCVHASTWPEALHLQRGWPEFLPQQPPRHTPGCALHQQPAFVAPIVPLALLLRFSRSSTRARCISTRRGCTSGKSPQVLPTAAHSTGWVGGGAGRPLQRHRAAEPHTASTRPEAPVTPPPSSHAF